MRLDFPCLMDSTMMLIYLQYTPYFPLPILFIFSWQLLDLGEEYSGSIETVAGRHGSPTLSYLSLVLTRPDQSGVYECSPSNTGHDQVTVHIVQGENISRTLGSQKCVGCVLDITSQSSLDSQLFSIIHLSDVTLLSCLVNQIKYH